MAKVRNSHGRVVFEGTNEDAERHLELNYPRPHVNAPGSEFLNEHPKPDAVVEYDEADSAEQPKRNASEADWRSFALANGATEEELSGLSRDQIRDQYGK
jgi:hypothetical protein